MSIKAFIGGMLSAALFIQGIPAPSAAAEEIVPVHDGYIQLPAPAHNVEPGQAPDSSAALNLPPLLQAGRLPAAYDLRSTGCITSVKDQGNTGMCVSFSVLGAIESSLILQGIADPEALDFSETHLSYYIYTMQEDATDALCGDYIDLNGKGSTGGNVQFATAALAAGIGPQQEIFCPFSSWGDTYSEYQRYASGYRLKQTENIPSAGTEADRAVIKNWLMSNGGVTFAFYSARSLYYDNGSSYAYYAAGKTFQGNANHAALIVGWDDNYSKENFDPKNQPAHNGAWLVRNSWSADLLDDGYFWISYDDPSMGGFYSFIMESADAYDDIYQYDGIGYLSSYNYASAANVFTADTDCTIEKVGIHLSSGNNPNTTYQVNVYALDANSTIPTEGTLLASAKGAFSHFGYLTADLDTAPIIKKGQTFSVVLSLRNPTGGNGYLAIEEENAAGSLFTMNYQAHAGESYIQKNNGIWYDTTECEGQYGKFGNVCIKAMTKRLSDTQQVCDLLSEAVAYGLNVNPAKNSPAGVALQQARNILADENAALLTQNTAALTLLAMTADAAEFPQHLTPYADTLLGDSNLDGTITIADAADALSVYAQRAAGMLARTARHAAYAMDYDQNQVLDMQDSAAILEAYANAAVVSAD